MRLRHAQRLAIMVDNPPTRAPEWVTPEMVVAVTPIAGLDLIAAAQMRTRRMALLTAVMRTQVDAIRRDLAAAQADLDRTAAGHGLVELQPVPKMDTPTGLFKAICMCGKETAANGKRGARASWAAHADAKISDHSR